MTNDFQAQHVRKSYAEIWEVVSVFRRISVLEKASISGQSSVDTLTSTSAKNCVFEAVVDKWSIAELIIYLGNTLLKFLEYTY